MEEETSLELSSHFLDFASVRRTNVVPHSEYKICIYNIPSSNEAMMSDTPMAKIMQYSGCETPYQYLKSNFRRTKKPMQTFCTGSRYIGEWGDLGFDGRGLYRFPHGVIYDGFFNNQGQFHGAGCLIYPNGQKLKGIWRNGKIQPDPLFIYNTGEYNDENLPYCKPPDRRFHVEVQNYFGQVGQEYLTSDQPTKDLPPGCYDVTYGIFNPATGAVTAPPKAKRKQNVKRKNKKCFEPQLSDEQIEDLRLLNSRISSRECKIFGRRATKSDQEDEIIEVPAKEKVAWIKRNCRRSWDEATGYVPQFYRPWMTGTFRGQQRESFLTVMQAQEKERFSLEEQQRAKASGSSSNLFSFIQRRVGSTTGGPRKNTRRVEDEKRRRTIMV